MSGVVPPSKNFEHYYKNFIENFHNDENHEIRVMAAYCTKCIAKICKVGPQGRTLSLEEIEFGWVLYDLF